MINGQKRRTNEEYLMAGNVMEGKIWLDNAITWLLRYEIFPDETASDAAYRDIRNCLLEMMSESKQNGINEKLKTAIRVLASCGPFTAAEADEALQSIAETQKPESAEVTRFFLQRAVLHLAHASFMNTPVRYSAKPIPDAAAERLGLPTREQRLDKLRAEVNATPFAQEKFRTLLAS